MQQHPGLPLAAQLLLLCVALGLTLSSIGPRAVGWGGSRKGVRVSGKTGTP